MPYVDAGEDDPPCVGVKLKFASKGKFSRSTGRIRCSYDKLEIVSSAWPGWLWKKLPIKELRRVSHSFNIREVDQNPYYRSRIILVCVPGDRSPLELLMAQEPHLLAYAVTVAEIAADALAGSAKQARDNHFASIGWVSKRRCVRGKVIVAYDDKQEVPEGLIEGPTLYYEDARSSVAFKSYCRHDKARGGRFSTQPITRWESTLKGSAIKRYFGGNQLVDLLKADLQAFVARNIRDQRVDYAALGKLLAPRSYGRNVARVTTRRAENKPVRRYIDDPDFWAAQVAYRTLRLHWYKDLEGCTDCTCEGPCAKHHVALKMWQHSPAMIRGLLDRLRKGERRRKPGRPRKEIVERRWPITSYKINRCFTAISP